MTQKIGDSHQVFGGAIGHGTVRLLLSEDERSPLTRESVEKLSKRIQAHLPIAPQWLEDKLTSENTVVATFGDGESIFAQVSAAMHGKTLIQQEDVRQMIEKFDALGLHRKTLMSAIHLHAFMEHFNIGQIEYRRSVGTTSGMILIPELWANSPIFNLKPKEISCQ